jgi:hypothetical protein
MGCVVFRRFAWAIFSNALKAAYISTFFDKLRVQWGARCPMRRRGAAVGWLAPERYHTNCQRNYFTRRAQDKKHSQNSDTLGGFF